MSSTQSVKSTSYARRRASERLRLCLTATRKGRLSVGWDLDSPKPRASFLKLETLERKPEFLVKVW